MSNLVAFLLGELNTLSSETRRKQPDIKDAADRAIAIVKQCQNSQQLLQDLASADDLVKAFILGCGTRNPKLVALGVGCLQRLISQKAVPAGSIGSILNCLVDALTQNPDIQLKVLQTVLPLLTNYENTHGELLGEALLLCFKLQDSKTPVINNTAAATLRQIVIHLFDRMISENKYLLSNPDGKLDHPNPAFVARYTAIVVQVQKLNPCALDAFLLFQDLCLLANGDKPVFLRLEYLNRQFGLELIESILSNHHMLFLNNQEFSTVLKDRLCPMIIKLLAMKNIFPVVIRLYRVIYLLIKHFCVVFVVECDLFMSMFVEILKPDSLDWQKVIVLEIFRAISSDGSLLRKLFESHDDKEGAHMFLTEMITLLERTAADKAFFSKSTSSSTDVDGDTLDVSASMRVQCIDQLEKIDPPQLPELYVRFLSLTCLTNICENLAGHILPIFIAVEQVGSTSSVYNPSQSLFASLDGVKFTVKDTASFFEEQHPEIQNVIVLSKMISQMWRPLQKALAHFLHAKLDADLFHSVMKAIQNICLASGVLRLQEPRNEFLTSISQLALTFSVVKDLATTTSPVAVSFVPDLSHLLHIGQTQNSPSANVPQNTLTLLPKNVSAVKVLQNISTTISSVLDESAWQIVLETLQFMDIAIQNKAELKLSNKRNNFELRTGDADTNLLLTAIHQIFDISKWMDDKPFCIFVRALGKLSASNININEVKYPAPKMEDNEVINEQNNSNEISQQKIKSSTNFLPVDSASFAVEKIRVVFLINIRRFFSDETSNNIQLLEHCWNEMFRHILDISCIPIALPNLKMQACTCICDIVTTALSYSATLAKSKFQTTEPVFLRDQIQLKVLIPLRDLISNVFLLSAEPRPYYAPPHQVVQMKQDVQKTGLTTLNKLLQSCGQHLTSIGYSVIFEIFGEICAWTEDNQPKLLADSASQLLLIRTAFPSLQLICTEFISALDQKNLHDCVKASGAFASQAEDINISLTSIGLLWSLCDSSKALMQEETPTGLKRSLWLSILDQFRMICKDPRTETRNTAAQTLFRSISMTYGPFLKSEDWHTVFSEILFPVIESVQAESERQRNSILGTHIYYKSDVLAANLASAAVTPGKESIIKHWNDTKILLMHGINQIMNGYFVELLNINSFQDFIWRKVLRFFEMEFNGTRVDHIGRLVVLKSASDVTLAAVKDLRSIFSIPRSNETLRDMKYRDILNSLFIEAWHTWTRMTEQTVYRKKAFVWSLSPSGTNLQDSEKLNSDLVDILYKEDSLVQFLNLFTDIWFVLGNSENVHEKYRPTISVNDLDILCHCIRDIITYFDFSYLNEKVANKDFGVEINFTTSPGTSSYAKIHSSDADSLTMLQYTGLEIVLGKSLLHVLKMKIEELKCEPGFPLVRDENPDQTTCVWEFVRQLETRQSGDLNVATVLVQQVSYLLDLPFRRSALATFSQPNHVSLVSTRTPSAILSTLQPNAFSKTSIIESNQALLAADIQSKAGIRVPTFISLGHICLRAIAEFFSSNSVLPLLNDVPKDALMYESQTFSNLLKVLGKPMSLKYDSCSSENKPKSGSRSPSVVIWKQSVETFLMVTKQALKCAVLTHLVSTQCRYQIWDTIAEVVHCSILSKSLPPPDLPLEEVDDDQDFEIKWIQRLVYEILFTVGDSQCCSDQTLLFIIRSFTECSNLWVSDNVGISGDLLVGTHSIGQQDDITERFTVVPVVREKVAKHVLKLLFTFCNQTDLASQEHIRFAQLATAVLIKRCLGTLALWYNDKAAQGLFPLPRIRNEELSLILQECLSLTLYPECFEHLPFIDFNVTEGFKRLAKDQIQQAHLLFLYDALLSCLPHCGPGDTVSASPKQTEEPASIRISDLVLQCMRRLGHGLDLPQSK